MNSTSSSFINAHISGLGYGFGVTIGILFLLTTIALASYYCTRNQLTISPIPTNRPPDSQQHSIEIGLDDATLSSYPVLLYSEAKLKHKDSTSSCCSICLMDYKGSDEIRMLPDCSHVFHVNCVDPWLRMHPTCPVCRTTPIPTPVSTPLAEVASLASRPRA